ncbi:MAG: O-methyltransferase [Bacteroidetes bacterium]|uniref:O-methyltransferase n=1 Tax=Candidatus Cryptobacteroides intestinavium TaxID=2840766 RepID=A0A9D9ER69_9BACT|nr:O-methyltransferase [Candidatus Cryptobacteroides intestinavium]
MDLYRYIENHSTPQGEALDWVERQTNIRTNHSRMLSGAVQGRLIMMLTEMIRPVRILELGTFTGYSSICLATYLPEGGHLDTLEINDELEDLILEGFDRAGLSDMITLHIGDCRRTLEKMCAEGTDPYDMVYIDANKREYPEYYDLVFPLVRPGGYILADNVLWDGKVYEDNVPGDRQTTGIARFNDIVAADPRVESVIIPVRDGLSLIRKRDSLK